MPTVTTWVTTPTGGPWIPYIYGNYMYVNYFQNPSYISRVDMTSGPTFTTFITPTSYICGLVISGNYMYIVWFNSGKIVRYNLTNSTSIDFVTGLDHPYGIDISGNNLYVSCNGTHKVVKINITNQTTTDYVTSGLSTPSALAIRGDYLYIASTGNDKVVRVNLRTDVADDFITTGLSGPKGLVISTGGYIYVTNVGVAKYISQINSYTGANTMYVALGFSTEGIAIYQNNLYIGAREGITIYKLDIVEVPIIIPSTTTITYPCFKEGSLILTDKRYRPVEDLKPGDLVKTLQNGFVPIDMIGKRDIVHSALKDRIKDQLYKCTNYEYPDIFEPLVLTGCHSILVDEYEDEEQKQKTIEINGDTYVTDKKYRLPACADPRASVYETPGTYTIYHLALENENYYANYGIYANGLLVESCSKRYIKELSGMELIKQ